MINSDTRKLIYLLHEKGHSVRHISRTVQLSRTAVARIISDKGEFQVKTEKADDQELNKLIMALYADCKGHVQRVYERLNEEKGIAISYPSVTRRVRELALNKRPDQRAARVPDSPGDEMQHDTSVYTVLLGDKKEILVASLIYYRYSKMKYLKFYRSFDRFRMKCFLHEALMHYAYSARTCIIDNTNLARLRGSGPRAIITEEMKRFATQYGFQFVCHEINHPDRKAGNERSFWTVETNFFPGRTFKDLADLNKQALAWATIRMANRPVGKTHLIPAAAFEQEKHYLQPISEHTPAPYRQHERSIDQYGYIAFAANYYWVPRLQSRLVTVLEYSDTIKIYDKRVLVISYPLLCSLVKNQIVKSDHVTETRIPNNYTRSAPQEEEKRLRTLSPTVDHYLTWILTQVSLNQKPKRIRALFRLSQQLAPEIFISTLQRAADYQITDISSLENMAFTLLKTQGLCLPNIIISSDYENRNAFQEGRLSQQANLSIYNSILEEKQHGNDTH